jgi:hypothetical protein
MGGGGPPPPTPPPAPRIIEKIRGWDTTGERPGTYDVVGYVTYDGLATDPMAVAVATKEYRVYLPLVMRNVP